MSDVSRIIRERALAILRETRSKIDPALLDAMKDHISAIMPQANMQKSPDADMPLSRKIPDPEQKFVPPVIEDVSADALSVEAVDKQKIARIVVEYMKHRENGSQH